MIRADAQVLDELRTALAADAPPAGLDISVEAFLAALPQLLPAARARHRDLGLSAAVSRDTLRDVGRKLRLYGGSVPVPWLVAVLRADVVSLGRLQLSRLPGDAGHDVHVPELGPLLPGLVDESLRRATAELGATAFTCTSWLLDPFVAEELPDSNIARFAARFAVPAVARPVGPRPTADDAEVARFVFRRPVTDVLDGRRVTPRTRLERLVVRHLRAGEHWTVPQGVMAGPPTRLRDQP